MKAAWIVLGLIALTAFLVTMIVYSRRREAQFVAIWREFTRARSYRWLDPSGPWYARKNARIVGEHGGSSFELDRYVVSTGKAHVTYTRVRARAVRTFAERLILRPRHAWLGPLDKLFQGPFVEFGERDFDTRWVVSCASRDFANRVLDGATRKLALAFPRGLRLEAKAGEVTLRWNDAERDPKVLDAAIEIASRVANAVTR